MAGDPRVLGLLEEMLDAGRTPEEVCRGCPELLAEVRARWKQFCLVDAAVVELIPGIQTTVDEGTPLATAADPLQIPGYELFGEVGRGGMGVVYRAPDHSLDRDVAVKLLQDNFPADSPIARPVPFNCRSICVRLRKGVFREVDVPSDRHNAFKLLPHPAPRPQPLLAARRARACTQQACG